MSDSIQSAERRKFLKTAAAGAVLRPSSLVFANEQSGKGTIVPLSITDPQPHFEEAWRDRHLPEPRYDIPPRGFNERSFFDDALVNFDTIRDWTAQMRDCEGVFCLSKDQADPP